MRQGAHFLRRAKPANWRDGLGGGREIQGELRQAVIGGGGVNDDAGIVDVQERREGPEGIEERVQLLFELRARDRALVKIERKPRIRRGEARRAGGAAR
jgi:hypothetical protein